MKTRKSYANDERRVQLAIRLIRQIQLDYCDVLA